MLDRCGFSKGVRGNGDDITARCIEAYRPFYERFDRRNILGSSGLYAFDLTQRDCNRQAAQTPGWLVRHGNLTTDVERAGVGLVARTGCRRRLAFGLDRRGQLAARRRGHLRCEWRLVRQCARNADCRGRRCRARRLVTLFTAQSAVVFGIGFARRLALGRIEVGVDFDRVILGTNHGTEQRRDGAAGSILDLGLLGEIAVVECITLREQGAALIHDRDLVGPEPGHRGRDQMADSANLCLSKRPPGLERQHHRSRRRRLVAQKWAGFGHREMDAGGLDRINSLDGPRQIGFTGTAERFAFDGTARPHG